MKLLTVLPVEAVSENLLHCKMKILVVVLNKFIFLSVYCTKNMLFCHPNKQMWACVPWKNRVLQPSDKIAMKPSPFNWQLTDFFRNTNIFQYSRVWIKKTRVWMRWKSTFIPLLQKELSHHSRSYETCATGTVLFVCCYCQSSSWHSGIDMHKIKHTCLNYTH